MFGTVVSGLITCCETVANLSVFVSDFCSGETSPSFFVVFRMGELFGKVYFSLIVPALHLEEDSKHFFTEFTLYEAHAVANSFQLARKRCTHR